jgi:glycine oxidase
VSRNVVVIGAGVIGSLCAFSLAKAGARVTLLEKEPAGPGASGNSAAMLEAQLDAYRGKPFVPLATASQKLFPALRDELLSLTGIDIELEQCGILQAALDEKERESLMAEMARHNVEGWSARWLEPAEIALEFPALTHQAFGAIFYEDDGQVNGTNFLEAARKAAEAAGAKVDLNSGEVRLTVEGGRVTGVEGRQRHAADTVVVAAGAWTDTLIAPLGAKLGIEPVRGQLLWYQTDGRLLPAPVYTKNGAYLCPKSKGVMLAGTTTERAGFSGEVTDEGRRSIAAAAARLSPDVAAYPIFNETAGLRPGSPDGLPFIGPLAGHPEVIIAAGHHRNGILLAPITAEIVAAQALALEPPIDPAPFSPSRTVLAAR